MYFITLVILTENNFENSIIDESLNKIDEPKKEEKTDYLKEVLDFGKDLLIIFLLVLFIRTFLVIPFKISGQSMYNSYYDKEFIIVDRFSYLKIPLIKDGDPKRGDVIVFKPNVSKYKEYFIKRIIGLPGDKLKIDGGKVYLYDKSANKYIEIKEEYLSPSNKNATFVNGSVGETIYDIPNDSYFVMGDNRNNSTDARECFSNCFGVNSQRGNFINKDDITGIVLLDLGYYNWIDAISFKPFSIKFGKFSFIHPDLGIDTHPRWFDSPRKYDYNIKNG